MTEYEALYRWVSPNPRSFSAAGYTDAGSVADRFQMGWSGWRFSGGRQFERQIRRFWLFGENNDWFWERFSARFAGDADAEFGVAGLGGEGDHTAVLLDNALHDAEAEAGAYADGFSGVEGVEDVGLAFERDAGAVVGDGDAEEVAGLAAGVAAGESSSQVRMRMRPCWATASMALSRRLVQIWLRPEHSHCRTGRLAAKSFSRVICLARILWARMMRVAWMLSLMSTDCFWPLPS